MVSGFLRENSRRTLEELTAKRLEIVASSFEFDFREEICNLIEENVRVISSFGLQFLGGSTHKAHEDLTQIVLEKYSISVVRKIEYSKYRQTRFVIVPISDHEAQNYFITRILPELKNYRN